MLARNIGFGLASSAWTAVLGFAVVPVYLRFLGIEAYGLIGFFATLQVLFQLLDMGMAPTVNREVARHASRGDPAGAAALVSMLSRVYWLLALALALVIATTAPLVALHWLNANKLPTATVQQVVMLLGLVIAARWPSTLYLNVLLGAQRVELSSMITAASVTLASVGAVLVLWLISPTLQAFFFWQLAAAMASTMAMRWAAWRTLGGQPRARTWDWVQLKAVWRFSAGMSAIALMGIVFTQLDKLVLSRILPLAEFGQYMLATTLCSGLYVLVTPFYNAVFPRFTALAARGDVAGLAVQYRVSTRLLTAILFPVAAFLAFFSFELLSVWTSNQEVARAVAPVVSLMAVGCALHGVMFLPHALQLAHGLTRMPLSINATLMIVFAPMIFLLAQTYGALGGALAWLLLHVAYVLLSTVMTHRQLLPGLRVQWIAADVALPFLVSVSIVGAARVILSVMHTDPLFQLLSGIVGVAAAAALCVFICPALRWAVATRMGMRSIVVPRESV
jgi:O-antigen/teichoic acid export membrane protein